MHPFFASVIASQESDRGAANRDAPDGHQHRNQSVTESKTETHSSLIVGVLQAGDLAGVTSSTIFRKSRKSQTLRRYVRVSVSCLHEGREHKKSGQTSSVIANGSTCRWGDKGSRGESVCLPTSSNTDEIVLEVEAWSDQSSNSAEDLLLGRGKVGVRDLIDSHSRWIALDPRGKVEVWVSTSTSPPDGEGAEHLDRLVQEGIHADEGGARGGRTTPLGADDKCDVAVSAQGGPFEVTAQKTPSSPKWGRPRLPDLKNVLMAAGRGRALTQKHKQPQTATVSQMNGESGDGSSQIDVPPKDSSEIVEERRGQVTSEKKLHSEKVTQAHQRNHGAKQGIQLMKDNFQARLLGARSIGKHREKDTGGETEDVLGTELPDEGSLIASTPPAASGTLKRMHSEPSDVAWTRDEEGTSEAPNEQENNRKRAAIDGTRPGSSGEDHAKRRQSSCPSPLRSLLQDGIGDGDAQRGEGHEGDENDATDEKDANDEIGGGTAHRRKSAGGGQPSVSEQVKELVVQIATPLDAMISVKAAASRTRSTWSSPNLTSTLKGFRRNKPKEEAVADASTSSHSADAFSPTSLFGADQGDAPAKCHGRANALANLPSKPVAVRVTIFRAHLPEGLATGTLGGTKHRTAFVRLKIGDAFASTSVVQAGACECRWTNTHEGESVDIPIPSANLPDFEASTLVLEVWNKAIEELEEGTLMGKTEILVSDWLGKEGWATLDGKQCQGGQVKLSVALKTSASNGDVSDNVVVAHCDASKNTESQAGEETGLINTDPNAIRTSNADVSFFITPRQMEETTRQSEININNIENNIHEDSQSSTRASKSIHILRGGKLGVPPIEDKSHLNESQQSTSSQAENPVSVRLKKGTTEATMRAADYPDSSPDTTKRECARGTDIRSPVLHQEGVRVGTGHVDDQDLLMAVPGNEKAPPPSSDALGDWSSERDHNEGPEVDRTGDTRIHLAHSTPSGESIAASLNKVGGANMDSPFASLEPVESHERTTKVSRRAIAPTTPNAKGRTASTDESEMTSENLNTRHLGGLGRRTCGGTATALDVAAAECTRGQQAAHAHTTEVKSTAANANATVPRERPETSQLKHETTVIVRREYGTDLQTVKSLQEGERGASTNRVQKIGIKAKAKAPEAQTRDNHEPTALAQTIRTRIDRARDISQRRREAVRRNQWCATAGLRSSNGAAMVPPRAVQTRAATTIQSGFRGRTARRKLRLHQRSVVKIQAVYRGHMERKEYVLQVVRARRAKAEERRARARRSRIAFVSQVSKPS